MKFSIKKKLRNTKNHFYYLRYPTFFITIFKNNKAFYQCFKCKKFFCTKYRLSRHFTLSKCLTNTNFLNIKYSNRLKRRIFIKNSNTLTLDFNKYNKEFLKKKNKMHTVCIINDDNINYHSSDESIFNDHNYFEGSKSDLIQIINNEDNLLGGGNFSKVYAGKYGNFKYFMAIKKPIKKRKYIKREADLSKSLKGINGVPRLINCINGKENKMIITDLYGPSLDKLHYFCNSKFNDITMLMFGIKVLKILRNIHHTGIIHRDIKPANICYGTIFNKSNKFNKEIVLIDFGLGKKYFNQNLRSEENKKNKRFCWFFVIRK